MMLALDSYQETPALKRWASSRRKALEGQADVIPLSLCVRTCHFLDATHIVEAPVVRFDSPGLARQAFPLLCE